MDLELLTNLKTNRIKSYGEWDIGESVPLVYLVTHNGSGDKISIYSSSGSILYEKTDITLDRIYTVTALRTMNAQLVFEYGEGGNESYVQMLDFIQNAIKERIQYENGENSFSGGIVIQPQFRSGVNSAKEPFEILLTEFGLPSPNRKSSKILRFDGNIYRSVGVFDVQQVQNFKETLITRK